MELQRNRMYPVSIEVPGHGQFKCRLGDARHANRSYTKRALAKAIATSYEGNKDFSVVKHWLVMDKWMLAVIYCGLIAPLN